MTRAFDHVDTWIFDLDNTLYPSSCRLFDQIDERMGTFISELLKVDRVEARRIQKQFFYEHGTTLRGLMTDHGVHPDAFLDFVHDIDHTPIPADPALADALQALPGRKLVFTNGTVAHADKVLARLGLGGHFSGIFDIVHADYIPKPELGPYEKFVRDHAVDAGPRRDVRGHCPQPRSAPSPRHDDGAGEPSGQRGCRAHEPPRQRAYPCAPSHRRSGALPPLGDERARRRPPANRLTFRGSIMDENQLRGIIEQAFEARDGISSKTTGEVREAVEAVARPAGPGRGAGGGEAPRRRMVRQRLA
jgi:pyrimidine 5'-nucleotidase